MAFDTRKTGRQCLASPGLVGETPGPSPWVAAATGVAVGYAVFLLILLFGKRWIVTGGGVPAATDFLAHFAAGVAALRGNAASVYDPHTFHALQISLTKPFPNDFYWNYPPAFFFVVAPMAMLPYVPAALVWIGATSIVCALILGRIAARPEGIAFAAASPAFLLTAYVGQNGFLTAALMGALLLALPKRPIVAGILLALMTCKPQLGILLPAALVAAGYWRALCWGLAATAIVTLGAASAFGTDSYLEFVRSLAIASHSYLTLGGEGWSKIESLYSIARFLGADDREAWTIQLLATFACAVCVFRLWRSDAPYELKAAGCVAATMLSIPYLHEYDFPVLLVAFAFLYRQRAFDRVEWIAVIAANLLIAAFLAQLAPIGPVIVMIAGVLILRRIFLVRAALPSVRSADMSCPSPIL